MKNKKIRVALYDPYLNTLGGGEKFILSVLEVLAEQGFEINIFWDKNLNKEIKDRFAFRCIDTSKFLPDIFKNKSSALKTLRTLQTFDYFFYVTDGSYFFSGAKNNFVYAMIPDKKLYNLNLINRLKLINYKFITHSLFTQKWLSKFGVKSTVIMPYLDDRLVNQNIDYVNNGKIILSVGRFFSHLHSKKHDEMIKAFKILKKTDHKFKDFKLILAGGLMKEDRKYFDNLKKIAGNDPSIIFKPNIEFYRLYELYRLSTFYWHFTGYGTDEEKNPELAEHFGITPLEAMASGCLVFCYSGGGPKELIKDGENGFLFSSVKELISKMIKIEQNETYQKKVINNGKLFINNNFSYSLFREKVLSFL